MGNTIAQDIKQAERKAADTTYNTFGVAAENALLCLGVSSCLCGNAVRYNASHKRDNFLAETLRQFCHCTVLCPEEDCGMPTPRPAIQLELARAEHADKGNAKNAASVDIRNKLFSYPDNNSAFAPCPQLLEVQSGKDVSAPMHAWIARTIKNLRQNPLDGYIFKAKSPSCGMVSTPVFPPQTRSGNTSATPCSKTAPTCNEAENIPLYRASGLFANAFIHAFPLIPCIEESTLHNAPARVHFLERALATSAWRRMVQETPSTAALIRFHTACVALCRAHSEQIFHELNEMCHTIHANQAPALHNTGNADIKRDTCDAGNIGDIGSAPSPMADSHGAQTLCTAYASLFLHSLSFPAPYEASRNAIEVLLHLPVFQPVQVAFSAQIRAAVQHSFSAF